MKRLVFERTYQLESIPCDRCAGSGGFTGRGRDYQTLSTLHRGRCYWCKGLGWKPTPAGKALFYAIADLLEVKYQHRVARLDPYLIGSYPKLTDADLEKVDALMASRVGAGAVEVRRDTASAPDGS